MNLIYKKQILPFFIIIVLFLSACTKSWDEHYNEDNFDLPDYSLYEFIESQGNLSTFASMLKANGYDAVLNSSQTYTVWAPTNDALSSLDLNNKDLVSKIVQNHIARNRYSTSNMIEETIKMLSGKSIQLSRESEKFLFGNRSISVADQATKNGLVHTMDNYVPYLNNIWEYIKKTDDLSSVSSYISSKDNRKFLPELSIEIGINDDGNPIYDSIFDDSNDILEKIGHLESDDTIYTVLLPNNKAWDICYSKIEKYYNIPTEFGGDSRKEELTQWGIVKDIVFRNRINNPDELDSIVSTTGSIFYNPGYLFNNANTTELSNGLVYTTNELLFPDTTSWIPTIIVEAENSINRINENCNIYNRSDYDNGVSDDHYILVEPTGTSNIALPSVTFSIPNTLSSKYKIYCVFVPSSFSNPSDLLPMKPTFNLTYINKSNGSTSEKSFSPTATTDPNALTKYYVGEFDFEYANIIDEEYDEVSVSLEVISNVKNNETNSYNRSMRIDGIILEPIVQ